MLGRNTVVIVRATGSGEGDHVASFFGVLESGHDYGALPHGAAAPTPARMPDGREAIFFKFVGQQGGFCLRPDQFTGASWIDVPEPRGSSTRELVIELGGVEVIVQAEGDTQAP